MLIIIIKSYWFYWEQKKELYNKIILLIEKYVIVEMI